MGNYLRLKKRKIALTFLLIFNQLIMSAYALNNRKIRISELEESGFPSKFHKKSELFISTKEPNKNDLVIQEAERLEIFVEETFDPNNINNLKNEQEKFSIENRKLDLNNDIENKKLSNTRKKIKNISKNKNIKKLPLPSRSKISSSEFKVPSRGYVRLTDQKISLNLKDADALETLNLIGKLGNYGIIIIEDRNSKEESPKRAKITADFQNVDISDVFNSILLSADLQAILENNIIFIGKNILNKSLKPKFSKTFRLNQVNAASVADYLSTLGAQISKVMLISGSINGQEVGDSFLNKKEFKDEDINSYAIDKGPLFGLVGTADLRLQTITLIGSKDLMKTAEKYIRSLDVRHRQVALTIKIIDVSLTKSDIKNNVFELRTGDTRFINNSGLGLVTGNTAPVNRPVNDTIAPNIIAGGLTEGNFLNWLEAKITNENAKVLASPTLILGENSNALSSGAASVDDGLNSATIGRPFKNEGFIKVGETVVTGFTQTANEGVVTCTAEEGTAGITFGAKVEKIDDNGYVSFALSPAISSVTKSVEIAGCGIQNTLSVRKLDTGSIRVKNGDTLILTGVLQDSDSASTAKVPILGDIPLLGSLFRNNTTQKRKSELIILVTPRILKDK